MAKPASTPSFAAYRTVGEAAAYLGVSRATLRNWDRSGKLTPRRHPQNGYRIYLHGDLETLLQSVDPAAVADIASEANFDWCNLGSAEHIVQFYQTDEFLVESLCAFVAAALLAGDCAIAVATPAHLAALAVRLTEREIDVAAAIDQGRYVALDAAETLADIIVAGLPDAQQFRVTLGSQMANLARGGRRIHAFGEMVALLWSEGNPDAAIGLEQLWNDLAKTYRFTLLCGYPMSCFADAADLAHFKTICDCHSRVLPTENYLAFDEQDERLRAIAAWEQKSQALAAEIAHRQEVENALARRERELADFFENASEGIHKIGPDGAILWANKAICDLLGYRPEEVIGHSMADFHADADVASDLGAKLARGETAENFPARLRCKNGLIKHVLINSNACFDAGKFLYTRCFTRDVTRQWQAESALREANRRKDEFLATLAHELRNPLAPIRNANELLKIDSSRETIAEVHGIMQRQLKQITRLVDDLLDISRITRDRLELRLERLELRSVIASAVETARPMIHSARHELSLKLPNEPVLLNADPARLSQVFANLLTNSAKYTEPGGKIEIAAEQIGREVYVSVRDSGIGIEPEALVYIFDMFRQVDPSLEKSQGGLGIGLTLVRRLVDMHGGTIVAHSEGRGKGSTFTVRLPVESEILLAPESPSPEVGEGSSGPLRILVVDDNQDSADTLCLLLRMKRHEVRTARDGFQAMELAGKFQPDMILMDVSMPSLNGYEATRRIRQSVQGRDVFIVALTGFGQPEDVERSLAAGCSAHLVKPVSFAALQALIDQRRSAQY